MLKIAIVEDDKADRAALVRYVQKYEEENGESFSISTFGDGLSFLAAKSLPGQSLNITPNA